MLLVLLVSIAGGLGAVCRFVLDTLVRRRTSGSFPVGTVIINLSGSFLLGLVTGLATGQLLPESWRAVVGTGFLGGYTTFSTASFETVRLLERGRYRAALFNGIGVLALALLAAGAGLFVGLAL
ncbi:fluoride efflux transporter CrcB [Microlunatus panaciterrae]|uniref:Fluoride-specific ion channel FluC n=1 Tax=Microlunatus panaciterrae TaxID=400768 RepID=A0ABS2RIV6_9ACTN|nr:fluoride efflux transporter CrcB [Microlunatus panaciterrae]MBM7798457.1 CrcB protein [Microlunatus panaciterrae]